MHERDQAAQRRLANLSKGRHAIRDEWEIVGYQETDAGKVELSGRYPLQIPTNITTPAEGT